MTKAEDPTLALRGVCAGYGGMQVLHGLDLEVRRGEVVTLLGANGAGKSTLMKVASGLLRAAGGSIVFHGDLIGHLPPDRRVRLGLALVPEGRRLFKEMTVRENIELGAFCRDDRGAIARDLERALALFPDLQAKLPALAGSLSGGQQQMVAVARAMMSAPRLLMLDEPTIGLAPAVVRLIGRAIREIRAQGVDVLLVEQNAETALRLADRAYVIENGRVVAQGPAADLAANDEVRRAYMGM